VNDRSVCAEAIRGLGTLNLQETPNLLLGTFGRLDPESKKAAIDTLSSRPAYASALLKAIAEGRVTRDSLGAYHARQIAAFGDESLAKKLGEVWGEVRVPSEKKKERISQLRSELSANILKTADLSQGRLLFNKVCANCHGLFGVGGNLGPDLTGSQRMNLEYLLENILEPNATVAADYRMSAVALKDGRLLTGLVFKRSNGVVEVAGPTERKTVPQDEIESIKPLNVSPMPENLLESLGKKDILNLFGYLMSPVQVNAAQ
ncbi:MAG: c-type cytochrome, partial [Gemmataceae bacterium]